MDPWLVRSTPERAVRVRALVGDIVLCSWARHFTLTVPLSTQVYKWVPAKCWENLTNCGGVTCDGLASLAASCYRNRGYNLRASSLVWSLDQELASLFLALPTLFLASPVLGTSEPARRLPGISSGSHEPILAPRLHTSTVLTPF